VNLQGTSCIIATGKSTCVSNITVRGPSGKTYSLRNKARGITTSNLITPNRYIQSPVAGVGPYYRVTTSSLGDAANYITFGENQLDLLDGSTVVAKSSVTGRCALGATWNGTLCNPKTPSPSLPRACSMEARICPDGSIMPRNENTCEWLPNQCSPKEPIDPLPPTTQGINFSCSKSTYVAGEMISCQIRGGVGTHTCWQT
jgi:hypothetical protein